MTSPPPRPKEKSLSVSQKANREHQDQETTKRKQKIDYQSRPTKKKQLIKKHQMQQGEGITSKVTTVNYVQRCTIEKGKASEISPNEVLVIPDISLPTTSQSSIHFL